MSEAALERSSHVTQHAQPLTSSPSAGSRTSSPPTRRTSTRDFSMSTVNSLNFTTATRRFSFSVASVSTAVASNASVEAVEPRTPAPTDS